jgi:uncharacterized protein YegP (UPF0339 family)
MAEREPEFEIYQDDDGEFRFKFQGANNEIVTWTEGYTTKDGVERAIEFVKKNAATARINDTTIRKEG